MVDTLLQQGETTTRSLFRIGEDNIFLVNGEFTEPGILENIAQTAAARAGYTSMTEGRPVQVGYIGSVKNFEIFALPAMGDQLETEIVMVNQVFNVSMIKGKVWRKDDLMAQCEMKIFISQ